MKKNFIYSLMITGFLIGILGVWQFNTPIPIAGDFPSDEVTARSELLKEFLDEQSYLQSRIVSLRKDIEEAQTNIGEQTEEVNFEILEALKKMVGLTEVSGSGLEIFLDDSPLALRQGLEVTDVNLVQASDIRDVVNILNAAKADGISINNQRVVADSAISSVGTTILVNNSHIAPPFIVNAVGDSELMLQRLLNKTLLPEIYERAQKSGLIFKISRKETITIPIYNGDLNTSYINLVEE